MNPAALFTETAIAPVISDLKVSGQPFDSLLLADFPNTDRISLNALIHGREDLLRKVVGKGIQFLISHQGPAISLKAKPAEIMQIILVSIMIAKEFLRYERYAWIMIQTSSTGVHGVGSCINECSVSTAYAILSIIDNGRGMDPFFLDQTLNSRLLIDDSEDTAANGFRFIHKMALQLGGHFQIESNPGIGTSSRVYIPIAH